MKKQKRLSIHKFEEKCEEYLGGWKRCQADFENYKKQQEESQGNFRKFATENLIMQILPVLDNFHASTDHVPEDQKESPWVAGIMHIQKQLEDVLKDNGVFEIESKAGDKFDHNIHDAIKSESGKKKGNRIVKIIKKGYKIGDKVIRPASVIVG